MNIKELEECRLGFERANPHLDITNEWDSDDQFYDSDVGEDVVNLWNDFLSGREDKAKEIFDEVIAEQNRNAMAIFDRVVESIEHHLINKCDLVPDEQEKELFVRVMVVGVGAKTIEESRRIDGVTHFRELARKYKLVNDWEPIESERFKVEQMSGDGFAFYTTFHWALQDSIS